VTAPFQSGLAIVFKTAGPRGAAMHFDDRIATVLRQPVTGEAIARIQYRQLVDLLGIRPSEANGPQIDAAYLRLSELSSSIPAAERAATLEQPELRLRSPRLVAHLAEDDAVVVSSTAIARARLGDDQWLDLIPALPVRARGFLRFRRDLAPEVDGLLARLGIHDRGLPAADIPQTPPVLPQIQPAAPPRPTSVAAPHPPIEASEGIAAIVRRIEEFRRTRQPNEDGAPAQAASAAGPLRLFRAFDFATDADAHIVWAEPGIAPMAVGLNLSVQQPAAHLQSASSLAVALRHRQPIRGAAIDIAGAPAISGEWQVDAAPRFDPQGGSFIGYIGRMRRPVAAIAAAVKPAGDGADRMRQILHELRTPVNAIQGFAEVIQQQLFGPTPHEYRALAASIAGDSARMLAGFEELERLVKLDGGSLDIEAGESDLAVVIGAIVVQLEAYTRPRRSGFSIETDTASLPVPLQRGEAERLIWRILATLAGAAAPNELLRLKLRQREDVARMTVRLPASLAGREEEELYHAGISQPQALAVGMFGAGFALRLAATEARAAKGMLEFKSDRIRLSLPGLTGADAPHSDAAAGAVLQAKVV
jgi:signal transduction histidine kinase